MSSIRTTRNDIDHQGLGLAKQNGHKRAEPVPPLPLDLALAVLRKHNLACCTVCFSFVRASELEPAYFGGTKSFVPKGKHSLKFDNFQDIHMLCDACWQSILGTEDKRLVYPKHGEDQVTDLVIRRAKFHLGRWSFKTTDAWRVLEQDVNRVSPPESIINRVEEMFRGEMAKLAKG